MSAPPLISARNLVKTYTLGEQQVQALREVSFEVLPGEFLAIMGPSGSGKSTLMNLIGALDTPTSGALAIDGAEISSLSSDQLAELRNRTVGFVFQQFNLLPALTAAENAAVPLVIQGYSKWAALRAAKELLGKMGMADRAHNLPGQLSGGQQQRVAIARALVHHPRLLVCDEPTSALDHRTGHTILELLRNIAIEGDRAVIIVTHDSRIFEFADTLARMDDGKIESLERNRTGDRALIA